MNLSRLASLLLLAATSLTLGCATYADRLETVRGAFVTGDLTAADAELEKGMKRRCDRDALTLDRAMLQLCSGKPREAEQTLRASRDRLDHLEQKAVGEKALSMLTDAEAEAYAGEDYEKVLTRVFLCLSNLMTDGGDAGAYALQVGEKQQQIIDAGAQKDGTNVKLGYSRVAVGPYLHGALKAQSHNYDDAERAATIVCSWQPDFAYGGQDLERAKHGRHSPPGHGVLYVFTLVGVGPHKVEQVEVPSTVSLLIADRIFSALGNQTLPPNIAPVKVPMVVKTAHQVGSIGVTVGGQPAGQTATITDVGTMAVEQYAAIYPQVVAEAVVRRIVKKGVVYGAKELSGMQKGSLPSVALDVVGVVWEASESADTRCWGLLPDKIQVLRVELPAGTHDITLQSQMTSGLPLGRPATKKVEIADGRSTYMLANFPLGNLVGEISTKTR